MMFFTEVKLWMVLYAGSQIGGTWGPLPYDMEECKRRAEDGNRIIAQTQTQPEIIAKMEEGGIQVPLRDWMFVCEEHDARPQIDNGASK
ncbi:hypothetical protein [Agrobacterium vitis]|uniref:hypothetical protein n=1 Tax=Agrobacterium vitis TaxID=373 RepID=UPI0031F3E30E|nr:hypothetical protein G6L01_020930 [Agrobacterium vitis]